MIHICCSKKLEKFIAVAKKTDSNSNILHNWNCHLIAIGGKKCLFFMEKKTLYSVLLFNFQKKDLPKIEIIFLNEFIIQLKADKIWCSEAEHLLRLEYANFIFCPTDNDRKTIGTMNDIISNLKAFIMEKSDKLESAKIIMHEHINHIPLGARNYKYAVNLMEIEMDNFGKRFV